MINNLKSKIISVILSIIIALGTISGLNFSAFALPTQSGDYIYNILADGTAELSSYSGNDKNLVIPSMIDGYTVTSIADELYCNCVNITNVTIPNSITSISVNAFFGCSNLNNVSIPNSVTHIYRNAFCGCSSLTSIMIPDSVQYIGDNAFGMCTNLTDITFSKNLSSLSEDLFHGCTSLSNIDIPDNILNIGCDAFLDTAYYNNSSNWDNGILYLDNCLISVNRDEIYGDYIIKPSTRIIAEEAFLGCGNLTNVTLPDSLIEIDCGVFKSCDSLTSITIPNSISYIGEDAFDECICLSYVYYPGTEVDWNLINIDTGNDPLYTATKYFNSTSGQSTDIKSNFDGSFSFSTVIKYIVAVALVFLVVILIIIILVKKDKLFQKK